MPRPVYCRLKAKRSGDEPLLSFTPPHGPVRMTRWVTLGPEAIGLS